MDIFLDVDACNLVFTNAFDEIYHYKVLSKVQVFRLGPAVALVYMIDFLPRLD